MRETPFRFTQTAAADLDDIWESIARDNQEAADRVVADIYSRVGLLAKFPRTGHRRKDLAGSRPLFFLPVGKYMVAYKSQRTGLLIIRILHAARDIAAILRETQDSQA